MLDANCNRASVRYPNGVTTTYAYDALNRLTVLESQRSDGTVVSRYQYTLGAAGNRTRIVEHTGRTVDYSYDVLYRLTREFITEPLGATTQIDYGYDAVGNRLSKTVDGLFTVNYAYDANDRLLSEGSTTYSYDANGNTLSKNDGSLTSYVYDAENRLIHAQTATDTIDYTYDANGIRQSQTVNGNTTTYLVDQNRDYAQVLEERDATGALIVAYTHGDDLLSQHRGGTTRYYHYDGLGSTRALTDATEATTDTYTYDAFGNLIGSTGTTQNNYLYTGEQYDPNIGFYYLRARYMNPENGRFLTTDPFPGLMHEPVTLHKYLYAGQNPVNNIDPSGLMSLSSVTISMNIQASLRLGSTVSYRVVMRKTGCYMVEYMVGEAFNYGIYVFLDGYTGKSYVGQTRVDFDKRLKQHMAQGIRDVKQVLAKFHIDPSIKGESLRILEQTIMDIVGNIKHGDLSNKINALNEAKRRALKGAKLICR